MVNDRSSGGTGGISSANVGPGRMAPFLAERDLPMRTAEETPKLRAVLDWWRSHPDLPRRQDVSPFAFPIDVLPRVLLMDLQRPSRRLLIRLAGTAICEDQGWELSGRYVDEIYHAKDLEPIMRAVNGCIDSRRPHFAERKFMARDGRLTTYRRLLLPLSDDGREVSGLLSCAVAEESSDFPAADRSVIEVIGPGEKEDPPQN